MPKFMPTRRRSCWRTFRRSGICWESSFIRTSPGTIAGIRLDDQPAAASGNRSRGVDDPGSRGPIRDIVTRLVQRLSQAENYNSRNTVRLTVAHIKGKLPGTEEGTRELAK